MSEKIAYVTLTLDCLHTVDFRSRYAPTRGQTILCRRCNEYRNVIGAPPSIRVKCDKCTLGRLFGRDIDSARRTASNHVVKRNTHTVRIIDGETVVEVVRISDEKSELPFASIVTDRVVSNRQHQRSLRELPRAS